MTDMKRHTYIHTEITSEIRNEIKLERNGEREKGKIALIFPMI